MPHTTHRHTMSPGRMVHWRPALLVASGSCVAAIIERADSTGSRARLFVLTSGFGPSSDMSHVERDKTAAPSDRHTWHWPDECPFDWPHTD